MIPAHRALANVNVETPAGADVAAGVQYRHWQSCVLQGLEKGLPHATACAPACVQEEQMIMYASLWGFTARCRQMSEVFHSLNSAFGFCFLFIQALCSGLPASLLEKQQIILNSAPCTDRQKH